MSIHTQEEQLEIHDRIRRSHGRLARTAIASAKVTRTERQELESAAKREGKALSEWGREVLLNRARKGPSESAAFTELIALRMLLNAVLRSIVIGRTMTEGEYNMLLAELRKSKHATAQDVLAQYQINPEGAQ